MPIPDFQKIMLPLLETLSDGKTYTTRNLIEVLSARFKLTDVEKREFLPSGQQPIFDNRVGWARTFMKKAGLLESERRATQKITQLGLDVLEKKPETINVKFLEQFESFLEFKRKRNPADESVTDDPAISADKTPEEILEATYSTIQTDLQEELLGKIKMSSPEFFEKLVVDLVVAMGYGGSRQDAGKAIGKSGDGGIDGIINEDRLGLDIIYIQAKRWENTVPVKEVRDFAGALLGKKARKGIFITTSDFPQSAYKFVQDIDHKIILIDGTKLVNLLTEFGIGNTSYKTYKLSRIDTDYFEE